jgi:hypothetical protein
MGWNGRKGKRISGGVPRFLLLPRFAWLSGGSAAFAKRLLVSLELVERAFLPGRLSGRVPSLGGELSGRFAEGLSLRVSGSALRTGAAGPVGAGFSSPCERLSVGEALLATGRLTAEAGLLAAETSSA